MLLQLPSVSPVHLGHVAPGLLHDFGPDPQGITAWPQILTIQREIAFTSDSTSDGNSCRRLSRPQAKILCHGPDGRCTLSIRAVMQGDVPVARAT